MSKTVHSSLPLDMCLLLRADAEQRWLNREVIPVLRQLEARERPVEEELGSALAYLEAMWSQARIRARETDAIHAELFSGREGDDDVAGSEAVLDHGGLRGQASRYHAAVRVLRELIATRVAPLVKQAVAPGEEGYRCAKGDALLAEAPHVGGCTPRAA